MVLEVESCGEPKAEPETYRFERGLIETLIIERLGLSLAIQDGRVNSQYVGGWVGGWICSIS